MENWRKLKRGQKDKHTKQYLPALMELQTALKEGKAAVIRNEQLPAPIYLSADAEGYMAVSMLCSHKQCELFVSGNVLECPCHGSEFSKSGEALTPPATEALLRYQVQTYQNDIIIIL